jgi:hypothetical protein
MREYTLVAVAACAGLLAASLILGAAMPATSKLISNNALLLGLAPGAVFPFVDTTPNAISQAHIAVTDSTSTCAAGAAAPANVQVLVGEAGVALTPVLTASTNTGITVTAGQCVFHVTVRPGAGGLPARVTDIVVRNAGSAALTGIHTVTVSAEVR